MPITPRPRDASAPRGRGPRVGRPNGSFTQKKRLDKLKTALDGAPLGLTIEDLALTLGVTTRSVRRYLRAFDGTKEGEDYERLESTETTRNGAFRWRIKPSERGRAVPLRRAQAYAILATRRALDVLRGSALHDEVDLALQQIENIAETPFRASVRGTISGEQNLEGRFFVLPPPSKSYVARGEDIDELFRAVADLRVLRWRLRPRANGAAKVGERIVFHPYAMVVHEGSILVVGARMPIGEIEVVPFDAMMDLRASELEHFELPETFELESWLHGALGVGQPATKARAIVEIDARVADEVRTKKVHPQQKIQAAPDGRLRIHLPLVNVDALTSWVLSFGDAARVVEPPELVRHVATVLERAASRYKS